jgi:hypothetical protein
MPLKGAMRGKQALKTWWVAYLRAADNVSRFLPIWLRGMHQRRSALDRGFHDPLHPCWPASEHTSAVLFTMINRCLCLS